MPFRNDYDHLAHPRVLAALSAHAGESFDAYGDDVHSRNAASYLRKIFGAKGAKVLFLAGGTQTNMVAISFALKPYEAVVCCDSGHIAVHETGAIEGSGHKVLTVPNRDGKLTAEALERICAIHNNNHMVKPKMAYISNSTETGTIYTKAELVSLRKACDRLGLYLFLDGARLGAALTCSENDIEPEEIGKYCDIFYVGGTKNGALFGEALVLVNPALHEGIEYHVKNKGALLAKGFVAGIMFEELFKDGLYFELAKKANAAAESLRQGMKAKGLSIGSSPTNQVFVNLPKEIAAAAIERFGCELWEEKATETTIRFVTAYWTREEEVREVLRFLS